MILDVIAHPARRLTDAGLAALLRAARKTAPAAPAPWEQALAWAGMETLDAPLADWCALGDGLGEGRWLRADPVQLIPNREHLVMAGNAHLGLAAAEARSLAEALAAAQVAPLLQTPHPRRWYWPLETPAGLQGRPWGEVLGGDLRPALPQGPQARVWRGRLAEVEMVLHGSEVNRARREGGRPTVDSLWLWGDGERPPRPAAPWTWLAGEDPLARGLARWLGVPHVEEAQALPAGAGLWFLDTGLEGPPDEAVPAPDWEGLRRRLRAGDWAGVRLALPGEGVFLLTRPRWWAFWRR